jgi:UDP-N-acetyl-D-mannosaminuronate dehydrogenase
LSNKSKVIVVGLGEVGKPLFELISEYHEVIGVDIAPVGPVENVDVLHVCYPFQIRDFLGETARYIDKFQPALTVIESTVPIGTTRAVADRTGRPVVNSPVRGKHARMLEEMRMYTKFIGAIDTASGNHAARHFESMGLKTKVLPSPETTELAKLSETTYFGLLIAWAQEVERYCDLTGANYDDVVSFYDEIHFFPRVKFFSGVIGGHCVMPNIELLKSYHPSVLLDAMQVSNDMKIERETAGRAVREERAASVLSGAVS